MVNNQLLEFVCGRLLCVASIFSIILHVSATSVPLLAFDVPQSDTVPLEVQRPLQCLAATSRSPSQTTLPFARTPCSAHLVATARLVCGTSVHQVGSLFPCRAGSDNLASWLRDLQPLAAGSSCNKALPHWSALSCAFVPFGVAR